MNYISLQKKQHLSSENVRKITNKIQKLLNQNFEA